MKEVIRLYGDKKGLADVISAIAPNAACYIFSKFLDTTIFLENIDQASFLDICDELDGKIYSVSELSLEETLVNILKDYNLHLATAESCTGGLVAASVVNVSGASEVFYEGVVTYSNESKEERLGVSGATLREYGAVSEQTAMEMASGLICDNVDVAVSTTGIAGPLGGTEEKPVGLVYIGIAYRDNPPVAYKYVFEGNRENIRQCAKNTALFLTWQYLKDNL